MKALYTRVLNFLLHKDNLFRIVALAPFVLVAFVATWVFVSLTSALLTLFYVVCGFVLVDLVGLWIENCFALSKHYKDVLTAQLNLLEEPPEVEKKVEVAPKVTAAPKPVKLKESRKSLAPPGPTITPSVTEPVIVKKKTSSRGRPKVTTKES